MISFDERNIGRPLVPDPIVSESVFEWSANDAKTVELHGSFNNWKGELMTKQDKSFFLKKKLKPGTYQYKFVVDGVWSLDPNLKTEDDGFGNLNHVLRVVLYGLCDTTYEGTQIVAKLEKRKYAIGENVRVIFEMGSFFGKYCLISFDNENYFQTIKRELRSKEFMVELITQTEANIRNLPYYLIFKIEDDRNNIICVRKFAIPVNFFTDLPENLNILLCGSNGIGKSAFINSSYTVLRSSSDVCRQMAPVRGLSKAITLEFRKYPLYDLDDPEEIKKKDSAVTLFDMWGFESDNSHNIKEFEAILEGMPTNFVKGALPVRATCPGNRPHSIIFFINPKFNNKGELTRDIITDKIDECIHKTIKKDIPFILVVPQIDTLPNCGSFRNTAKIDNTIEKIIYQVHQFFGVPENQIFPLVNYVKETQRNYIVDKIVWTCLSQAVLLARDKVTLKRKQTEELKPSFFNRY